MRSVREVIQGYWFYLPLQCYTYCVRSLSYNIQHDSKLHVQNLMVSFTSKSKYLIHINTSPQILSFRAKEKRLNKVIGGMQCIHCTILSSSAESVTVYPQQSSSVYLTGLRSYYATITHRPENSTVRWWHTLAPSSTLLGLRMMFQ